MMNDKDKMHPEDIRNLIIFAALSILIWFFYETYILAPQAKALKEAKLAREKIIQSAKPVAANLTREEAIAQTKRISFENEEIFGTISLKGAVIDDLKLSNYYKTLEKVENVELLNPKNTINARYIDYGWVTSDKNLNIPNSSTIWSVKDNDILRPDLPVTLFWDNGQGLRFERILSLDEQYVFTVTQRVYHNSGQNIKLYPYALVSKTGIPSDFAGTWVSHEGPIGFIGGELESLTYSSMAKNPSKRIEAETGWIGFSDKYWLTALMPEQGKLSKFRFKYSPNLLDKKLSKYQVDFTSAAYKLPAGGKIESSYHLYVGAKKVLVLEDYEKSLGVDKLDLAVDFGWFWFFTYPFFLALHYLGLAVGNMGVAIIILTAILRFAVFPLTNISYRSFAKMKLVAPKITQLREEYGKDKEKLQAAIVELYQKEGVNPMSGCLPILVQIPIFFAFYKILFSTIEVRHAPFFGWIQDLSAKDPTSIFNLFGLLPYDVPSILMIGAWPCMMLAVMLVQKQLNPPPQDKMQRDLMNIFPFFITFVMAGFASGLVIYWTFSALFSIIQQAIIMRSCGVPIYIFNKDKFKEELEAKVDEGPSVHPLIEMAEEETEKALFGDDEGAAIPEKKISPPKPKKKKKKK